MSACHVPLIPSRGSFCHCFSRLLVSVLAYKTASSTHMRGGFFHCKIQNFHGKEKNLHKNSNQQRNKKDRSVHNTNINIKPIQFCQNYQPLSNSTNIKPNQQHQHQIVTTRTGLKTGLVLPQKVVYFFFS